MDKLGLDAPNIQRGANARMSRMRLGLRLQTSFNILSTGAAQGVWQNMHTFLPGEDFARSGERRAQRKSAEKGDQDC